MNKLTPAEYYEHVKALFPDLESISNSQPHGYVSCQFKTHSFCMSKNCDWGDLTRWPPVEEWRDATEADVGKPCRVLYSDGSTSVTERTLFAVLPEHIRKRFLISMNSDDWTSAHQCQVRVEPESVIKDCLTTEATVNQSLTVEHPVYDIWTDVYNNPDTKEAEDVFGQPMDTAPRDGTVINLLMGGEWRFGVWSRTAKIWITYGSKAKWFAWDQANQPTAWRGL